MSAFGTKRTLGPLPIFQLKLARCAPMRRREFITFAGATAAAAAYGELLIDFWCRPRSSAGAASMGTKKMRHAIVKSLF